MTEHTGTLGDEDVLEDFFEDEEVGKLWRISRSKWRLGRIYTITT